MTKVEYVITKGETELGALGKRGLWLYELGDVFRINTYSNHCPDITEIAKFESEEEAFKEFKNYNSSLWITYGCGNVKILNGEEYAIEKYTYFEDDDFDGETLQIAPLDEASEKLVKELRQGM